MIPKTSAYTIPQSIVLGIPANTKYPWVTLQKGDSFIVCRIRGNSRPRHVRASMASQCINWGHRLTRRTGNRHLFRCAIEGAAVRVWRVI